MYCLPVVLFLKVADGDEARSTAQGELVLQWWPLHTGSCTVDAHQDQGGLPHTILQSPHIGVAVRGARHNAVGLRGPVNACGHNYESVNDGRLPARRYIPPLLSNHIFYLRCPNFTSSINYRKNRKVCTKLWVLIPPCGHTIQLKLSSLCVLTWESCIRITHTLRCFYSITKSKHENTSNLLLWTFSTFSQWNMNPALFASD